MKRKFISILLAALIFSITGFSTPLKAKVVNLQLESTALTNDDSSSFAQVNEEIKDMAKTLVNKSENNELKNLYNEESVQYAIMDGDKVIASNSENAHDEKITKDTMYGIGSISKMYVTCALMQLVDEGKVDLDLPLTNYIKDFKMADDRYVKITPRMLVNHSSGLNGTESRNAILINDNDTWTHDNFLKELSNQTLKANPGEFSVYCNDGFELAEILVEKVSGMSFHDYIEKNFSEKLGIKNTITPEDKVDNSVFARTSTYFKDGDPHLDFMEVGSGGISSTAEDVCRFVNAITRKDGKGLLSNNSVDAMGVKEALKGVWVTDGEDNCMDFGLGWDSVDLYPFNRYGIKACGKGGDVLTYHSYVLSIPEYNLSMAVLSSGGSSSLDLSFASASLLKILKAKNLLNEADIAPKWNTTKSESCPSDYFSKFDGVYNLGTSLLKVKFKDGVMQFIDPKSNKVIEECYHTYSNYFFNDNDSYAYRCVEEKNGKTYIEMKSYLNLKGLSPIADVEYLGMKLNDDELKKIDDSAWQKRYNENYFLLNEKYSSFLYYLKNSISVNSLQNSNYQYMLGDKIINDNEAVSVAQIPGQFGRDTYNYKFYTDKGINFAECGGTKLQGYNTIPYLSGILNNNLGEVTIKDDGFTRWFKVPDNLNGAVINIDSSANSAFLVCSKDGKCILDSYIDNTKKTILKAGDIVGFAGNKDERFKITIMAK